MSGDEATALRDILRAAEPLAAEKHRRAARGRLSSGVILARARERVTALGG